MTSFSRTAARAAVVSLLLGTAFALPASAQRVQDVTPLPASAPATQAAEPVSAPAAEPAGPRVRAEMARVEPAVTPAYSMKKKDSTITLSTVALILLVVVVVLLVV